MGLNAINSPPELAGIGTRAYSYGAATATVAGVQSVAYTAASAQSTHPVNATEVMVCATSACRIRVGDNPTAAAGTSFYLPANLPFHFRTLATDKIAAIRVTDDGTLTITPVA